MARGDRNRERQLGWVRQYLIGLVLGAVCAMYGVIAMLTRNTFMPGLRGGDHTLKGAHGIALALVYLLGGLFLVCRFFVEPRCRSRFARGQIYLAQNALLILLIAAAVYVLLKVGTAG